MYMYNDYIQHHGILGQKWGVRRFQNADGSLTSRGRKRYDVGPAEEKTLKRATAAGGFVGGLATLGAKRGVAAVKKAKESNKKYAEEKTFKRDGPLTYAGKERHDSTRQTSNNSYDHSKSQVSEKAISLGAKLATDLMSLNFVGAAVDVGKAVYNQTYATINNKRIEGRNSKGDIDTKTGFHKKDREYSKKEDMKSVNPSFKDFNQNSKSNCMLCTITYDLRRKGYAVSANKASYGYTSDDLTRWYPKVKTKTIDAGIQSQTSKTNSKLETNKLRKDLSKTLTENTIKELESQPPGSRGNLMVHYNVKGLSLGHSMVYEVNDNGKVEILDCQTGKTSTLTSGSCGSLMKRSTSVQYARLDNVDIDPTNIKEVAH